MSGFSFKFPKVKKSFKLADNKEYKEFILSLRDGSIEEGLDELDYELLFWDLWFRQTDHVVLELNGVESIRNFLHRKIDADYTIAELLVILDNNQLIGIKVKDGIAKISVGDLSDAMKVFDEFLGTSINVGSIFNDYN